MKKVLIFSIAYSPLWGGAELAIKEITERLGNMQFDLITLRFDKNLPKQEKIGNVNVFRIGFSKNRPNMAELLKYPLVFNKYFFPVTAFLKACLLHRKRKYDAIWSVMAAFAGFAALFFKYFHPRIPFLLTLQEGDPIESIKKKVRFISPLFKKIFTKADFIQAISSHLSNWALDMGFKGPLLLIPNAVDIHNFSKNYSSEDLKNTLSKAPDEKFIIHTGRLVKKNAIDDIIKALLFLPKNVKFLVLGSGPESENLKKLALGLGVDNRVKFLGFFEHREMVKYLKISDVFVRPSLSEGLGNSFLEAMAAEIPVIATPIGGIPDFLFDFRQNSGKPPTGLFCRVRDPQSIADKVKIILENNKLRQEIVVNAKENVLRNYDWDLIAQKMNQIFGELKVRK